MSFIGSDDPTRWDRGIDYLNRCGAGAHVPLLEAGKAGLMDVIFSNARSEALPFGRIRQLKKPVLILIGDDDDTPTGPEGWLCARQITKWATGAIVHGAGAERQHYETAVLGTLICQRFLMVDTASRFVPAWMAMLRHIQALAIIPRDGVHPRPQPAETVH